MNRSGKQKGGFNKTDMIGKKFGKLTVISEAGKNYNGIYQYNCICDCGNAHKTSGQTLRSRRVQACIPCSKLRGDQTAYWQGVGLISKSWWNHHVVRKNRHHNDRKRGRPVWKIEITMEYAWGIFQKQNGKCALTGVLLVFPKLTTDINSGTASLDRIDSELPYVEGNVQWVHKEINMLKSNFKQSRFLELCTQVHLNMVNHERNLPDLKPMVAYTVK